MPKFSKAMVNTFGKRRGASGIFATGATTMHDRKITGKGSQNTIISKKAVLKGAGVGPATQSESKGFDIGPHATNKIGDGYSNTHLSPGPRYRKHF